MKKGIFSICLLFTISILNIYAQKSWLPGYIIKLDGDTIYGQIEQRDGKSYSLKCHFKEKETSIPHYYTPSELIGYRFSQGRFYIAKEIKKINNNEPVFLEYLIKGKASIYHYIDDKSHYFIEKDDNIYELKNTKISVVENNTQHIKERKEYINTLTYLLQDANISNTIYQSTLSTKSLTTLAKKYNDQFGYDQQSIIYKKNKTPIHINLSVYSGISLNNINFGNITNSNYSPSYFIASKFEIENLFPREKRITFNIDLILERLTNYTLQEVHENSKSNITYNGTYYYLTNKNYYIGNNQIDKIDINIKTNVLKLPVTVNFYFLKGKTKPYVGAGLNTMFVLSQTNDFTYHWLYDHYDKSIPFFHVGYIGKFGMKFELKNGKGVFTELNFQNTTSTNINEFLRFRQSAFSLNFGYSF